MTLEVMKNHEKQSKQEIQIIQVKSESQKRLFQPNAKLIVEDTVN